MTQEERDELTNDIVEITEAIEKLEPLVYEEEARSGSQSINRPRLMELRMELAQKTALLQNLDK